MFSLQIKKKEALCCLAAEGQRVAALCRIWTRVYLCSSIRPLCVYTLWVGWIFQPGIGVLYSLSRIHPAMAETVRVRKEETTSALEECFEATDWRISAEGKYLCTVLSSISLHLKMFAQLFYYWYLCVWLCFFYVQYVYVPLPETAFNCFVFYRTINLYSNIQTSAKTQMSNQRVVCCYFCNCSC